MSLVNGFRVSDDRFELVISPTARRQLTDKLPEWVAFAAYEFIIGPLLDNPRRVGKRLGPPLADRHSARRGTYRIIYRIEAPNHTAAGVAVRRAAGAARPHDAQRPSRYIPDHLPNRRTQPHGDRRCRCASSGRLPPRLAPTSRAVCRRTRLGDLYLDVKRSVRRGTCSRDRPGRPVSGGHLW